MYKDGALDGIKQVTIVDGIVVSRAEALRGTEYCWVEVSFLLAINL